MLILSVICTSIFLFSPSSIGSVGGGGGGSGRAYQGGGKAHFVRSIQGSPNHDNVIGLSDPHIVDVGPLVQESVSQPQIIDVRQTHGQASFNAIPAGPEKQYQQPESPQPPQPPQTLPQEYQQPRPNSIQEPQIQRGQLVGSVQGQSTILPARFVGQSVGQVIGGSDVIGLSQPQFHSSSQPQIVSVSDPKTTSFGQS